MGWYLAEAGRGIRVGLEDPNEVDAGRNLLRLLDCFALVEGALIDK